MEKTLGQDIKDLDQRKAFLIDDELDRIREIAPEIPILEV